MADCNHLGRIKCSLLLATIRSFKFMAKAPTPALIKRLLKRVLPNSTAGKASWLTWIVLTITLLGVWIIRRYQPNSVPPDSAITIGQMTIEVTLVLLIPFVLYWGIRAWGQIITGEFPDIETAWFAGLNALETQGISTSKLPIFLILGSSNRNLEYELTNALNAKLRVAGLPDEKGVEPALQWYVSNEAIYLFCPGACCLSTILQNWGPSGQRPIRVPEITRQTQPPEVDSASRTSSTPANNPKPKSSLLAPKSLVISGDEKRAPEPIKSIQPTEGGASPNQYLGTIQMTSPDIADTPDTPKSAGRLPAVGSSQGQLKSRHQISSVNAKPDAPVTRHSPERVKNSDQRNLKQAYSGTVDPGNTNLAGSPSVSSSKPPLTASRFTSGDQSTEGNSSASPVTEKATFKRRQIALPADLDASEQLPRLQYLCQLLQRNRKPRCGVNGIVTLVPFDIAHVGPMQLSALSQAARSDITMIQKTLGVRIPVTTLLVGMEQDRGFIELVRRLQPELLDRRLGGRFDLRRRPTPDQLNDHSDELCDAFESWVYRLFGRSEALAEHRGNRKLYELISRIRCELKPRLRIFLGQAFGCETEVNRNTEEDDDAFFFSGCYFAASAETTGQAAFVKGVLQDKLIEEQSQVQWMPNTIKRERLIRLLEGIGWLIVVFLSVLLIYRVLMPL